MRFAFTTFLAATALFATTPALAEIVRFTATLNGAAETPPTTSPGKGSATLTLDTDARTVSWTVTYSGLSGAPTMAHIHGPAASGAAAGVQIPLSAPLDSPISGNAAVTDGQIGDLRAGLWYVNIHTAQNPKGEIRGQILEAK